jgi:hypothetical protein
MVVALVVGGLALLIFILIIHEWIGTALLIGFLSFIGVVAYFAPTPDPNSVESRLDRGEAILSSTAPDGTKLWVVRRGGREVYYSTAGTHTTHTERVSKHSTRTVDDDVSNGV